MLNITIYFILVVSKETKAFHLISRGDVLPQHLLHMGNVNKYGDGDIPRDELSVENTDQTGPGWAYYKSSVNGKCSGTCGESTNYWFVSIKSPGRFLCPECNNKRKEDNMKKMNIFKTGYGTMK